MSRVGTHMGYARTNTTETIRRAITSMPSELVESLTFRGRMRLSWLQMQPCRSTLKSYKWLCTGKCCYKNAPGQVPDIHTAPCGAGSSRATTVTPKGVL